MGHAKVTLHGLIKIHSRASESGLKMLGALILDQKSLQHEVFPGGHQSKNYFHRTRLNFGKQMRSSAFLKYMVNAVVHCSIFVILAVGRDVLQPCKK